MPYSQFSNVYQLSYNQGSGLFTVASAPSVGSYTLTEGGNGDGTATTGESVIITGTTPGSGTYFATVSGGVIVNQGGTYYLYTDNGSYTTSSTFGDGAPPSNSGTYVPGGSYSYVVCFLPGTLIATPEGDRAIETLAMGDLITLAGGKQKPVKWIGEMTVNLNLFNRHTASPILIRAGALGHGLPKRDLYTSYHHGFELEGTLVIAGVLVNGTSIVQCSDWPEQTLKFYQVEVEGHELMLAEGAPCETFGEDGDDRALFDNAAEYHALYPNAVQGEQMSLGRVSVARQLPRAIKERIEAAAIEMGYAKAAVA